MGVVGALRAVRSGSPGQRARASRSLSLGLHVLASGLQGADIGGNQALVIRVGLDHGCENSHGLGRIAKLQLATGKHAQGVAVFGLR